MLIIKLFLALFFTTSFFTAAYSQEIKKKARLGLKVYYGPQLSFFKFYDIPQDLQQLGISQLGVQKNILGKSYGLDAEIEKRKWIFGLSYSYNENNKRYKSTGYFPNSTFYADVKLRNIEQGIALYADRKINKGSTNELFLGLGHVFSRGEYQSIDIVANPSQYGFHSNVSTEGGLIGKFRWQHRCTDRIKIGMEAKVHYLYSVDSWTNICFVPYLKVVF